MSASPPVNPATSRLVSRFGVRPSMASGAPHMHAGLDLGTSKGRRESEPIYASKAGVVSLVAANTPTSSMSGYGNAVVLRHGDGTYGLYAHMQDGSITVRPGQTVDGGTQIGLMGNSTNGHFSPLPGESTAQWAARANAAGYHAPGPMVRHLHYELRVARPDGSSPFPGPYPTSPSEALFNRDPSPWFGDLGLRFSTRGAATIVPGSPIDRSRASWSQSMAGTLAVMGLDGDELDALGQETGYQPPEPERDAKWGISKTERLMLVTGGIVLTGTIAAFIIRSRMRPNRRRGGPRQNRLRAWGSK